MRIIAGLAKGRTLRSPIGKTRPTSDRAREALFSTIQSEFGEFTDIQFLDLFAGSGAVAAEALSRGVALVHAVESDERAVKIARENLAIFEKIPNSGISKVFSISVENFLLKLPENNLEKNKYDIIFMDPPYEMDSAAVTKILESLAIHIKSSSLIAVERDTKSPPFIWPNFFTPLKERSYGHATIYYGSPVRNG